MNADASDACGPEEVVFRRVQVSNSVWRALLASRTAGATAVAPVADPAAGEEAAWALYAPLLAETAEAPFVFAQIGQSLDGRVATVSGDARDISGRGGLEHLHRCRALADAVVVGVTTALKDDPRLTVRLVDGDNPARVVIDPKGRLDNNAALLREDGTRRLVVQACARARPAGVEVVRLDEKDGRLCPRAIVAALAARGLRRILVEGGGLTIGRFLDAGLVRRLHVAISPLLIGAGPNGLVTAPSARLADARRPVTRVFGLGSDVLFDCVLDQPAGSANTSTWPTTQEPAGSTSARR
jgi:riboflavin-specific deaminase-like protein